MLFFLRLSVKRNLTQNVRGMKVVPIPVNQDNYQYLIVDEKTEQSAIVDPVDVKSIASVVSLNGEKLVAGLVTHHHLDHAAGTEELANEFGPLGLKIYGGDSGRIKALDRELKHHEKFEIGSLKLEAIHTPCHTSTHVCYYVEDEEKHERAVFTGDTLFIGGCGRFFEGSAEQMHEALNKRLAQLPGDTVYCGHEYTVANLNFAKSVEPNNKHLLAKLEWAEAQRKAKKFTVPSTIDEEKTFNPFMRVSEKSIQEKVGASDPVKVMGKLREMKNNF